MTTKTTKDTGEDTRPWIRRDPGNHESELNHAFDRLRSLPRNVPKRPEPQAAAEKLEAVLRDWVAASARRTSVQEAQRAHQAAVRKAGVDGTKLPKASADFDDELSAVDARIEDLTSKAAAAKRELLRTMDADERELAREDGRNLTRIHKQAIEQVKAAQAALTRLAGAHEGAVDGLVEQFQAENGGERPMVRRLPHDGDARRGLEAALSWLEKISDVVSEPVQMAKLDPPHHWRAQMAAAGGQHAVDLHAIELREGWRYTQFMRGSDPAALLARAEGEFKLTGQRPEGIVGQPVRRGAQGAESPNYDPASYRHLFDSDAPEPGPPSEPSGPPEDLAGHAFD